MTNDSDRFFGGAQPRSGEPSRPRAVNPMTGQEQSWQRASNYAAPLDNPHGLIRWQLRALVMGLSMRQDLARMLLTGAVIDDKDKADEVISAALAAAETDSAANEGTAVHAALSRSFLGNGVPSEYAQHVATFVAELRRNGLTPVATEVRVLCVSLGVIGHTDWVVRTQDGRHLILDVKTGKLGDAKRKFAIQCKAYAGAEYIDDGKGGWQPTPFAIDQTEAILAHVDPITGATALYRVDLVLGLYGATLAERVRDWNKIEVLSPYTPVHHAVPATALDAAHKAMRTALADPAAYVSGSVETELRTALTPMEMIIGATSLQTLDMARRAAERADATGWTDELHSAAMAKRAQLLGGITMEEAGRNLSEATRQIATAADVPVERVTEAMASVAVDLTPRLDELMSTRNTKSVLQKTAKDLGCTDLAHDRKWLALWIIATESGADPAQAARYAKSKGAAGLASDAPAQAEQQAQPRSAAESTPFALKHIREAATVTDIERFRLNIVTRSGDHAWTDEMTQAARERIAELGGPDAYRATALTLGRIAVATEPKGIAELWEEVTLGGSAPDEWTDEIRAAANARLAELAHTATAPVNPYGPQQ